LESNQRLQLFIIYQVVLKLLSNGRAAFMWVAFLGFCVAVLACERIVDIESPYPIKAEYCSVNQTLMGRWQSDSVWVITKTDSTDTSYINRRPTYYYDLTVDCDMDTSFLFTYINFSGVVTREAYSVNFTSNDTAIFLFDELDFDRESTDGIFKINYDFSSDSTFVGSYDQDLNSNQRTETTFWMQRVN
jgi:hypothetical protein